MALHTAQFRFEVASADVLVTVSRLDNGLNPNNALSIHNFMLPATIKYLPVPAQQFYIKMVVVFDGNSVGKHEFIRYGITIVRLVESFYTYFDAFGNHGYHGWPLWGKSKVSLIIRQINRVFGDSQSHFFLNFEP